MSLTLTRQLLEAIAKIQANTILLQSGKLTRKEAFVKLKFAEEDQDAYVKVWKPLADIIGYLDWFVYKSDEDVELEGFYSDKELEEFDLLFCPHIFHCTQTYEILKKVALQIFPETKNSHETLKSKIQGFGELLDVYDFKRTVAFLMQVMYENNIVNEDVTLEPELLARVIP